MFYGYEVTYWGAKNQRLKFALPHVLGKVDCPYGSSWYSSSDYGMAVKINRNNDLRRFSIPHHNTKNRKQLYDEQTSVERCNFRFIDHLTANDLHVGGIDNVKTHIYLNAIVLLASALAMAKMTSQKKSA